MQKNVPVIAKRVFEWSFSLALVLAVIDWVRPYTVAPFFNVGWLIALAVVALVTIAFFQTNHPES
jgi:hypothetical protein